MSTLARTAALGFFALAAGCTSAAPYVYYPAEQPTARIDGHPAARYAIPPESPRGDVRIASLGFTEVSPDDDPYVAALHVRMLVSNDAGAGPWSVDTREFRVELRGGPALGQPYVNTDASTLPAVAIQPGQQRKMDLYFPLPRGMDDPDDVPAFDVTWKVRTDTREVVERTPFERIELESEAPRSVWVTHFGPTWYYDPWGFPPRPGVVIVNRPHRVIVRRPAR